MLKLVNPNLSIKELLQISDTKSSFISKNICIVHQRKYMFKPASTKFPNFKLNFSLFLKCKYFFYKCLSLLFF